MTDEELIAMVRAGEQQSKKRQRRRTRSIRQILLTGKGLLRCRWCKCILTRETATVDHIVPISHGGRTTKDNCVLSCEKCNHDRGVESNRQPREDRETHSTEQPNG